VAGLRAHLRELSGKRYHELHGLAAGSVDFVLLFVPIEAAFLEALGADAGLYEDAARLAVILVSPTTLMAVLKTIAASWKHERQEKNALRIAKEAEGMLEQLGRWLEHFKKVGDRLEQAQSAYADAQRQLATGRGNVLGRLEKLHELGVKASKRTGLAWQAVAQGEPAEPPQRPADNDDEPVTGGAPSSDTGR
jgi:DNA recombination protein RmuC